MRKKAFASAVFALLAALLLAYVGVTVMLSSNAGSHSNDLLQAQLTFNRFYDARRMVARSFTDSLFFVANSKFGCSSAAVQLPPYPTTTPVCAALQSSVSDITTYEQKALETMNDSVATVGWNLNPNAPSNAVNCEEIAGDAFYGRWFNVTQDVRLIANSTVARAGATKHYWRQLAILKNVQGVGPGATIVSVTITMVNNDDPGGAFGIQTANIKITC